CLITQRDPIQTAKLVASLDQVSGGRFLFGIGGGWNAEEMEDHGTEFKTRFKLMHERVEAMKEIWTKDAAEYHGDHVAFGPTVTRPARGPVRHRAADGKRPEDIAGPRPLGRVDPPDLVACRGTHDRRPGGRIARR